MPLMVRVGLLVLLTVAAAVAYPWAAVAVGAAFIAAAVVSGRVRARRYRRPVVGRPAGMSLDRRVALRRAYRELNEIEAAVGLPPTPPPL